MLERLLSSLMYQQKKCLEACRPRSLEHLISILSFADPDSFLGGQVLGMSEAHSLGKGIATIDFMAFMFVFEALRAAMEAKSRLR